jgi:hypothetical protein
MASVESAKAPKRQKHLHIQLTDDEEYAVRMVHGAAGPRKIGQWCRKILLDQILPQYEEMRKEGLRELTAGMR